VGEPFTEQDVRQAANVCLIGNSVATRLFVDEGPVGKIVRISGRPYEVVGVLAPKGQSTTGQDQDDTILLPFTTVQKQLRGKGATFVDDIMCSAVGPEAINEAAAQISELLRQRHRLLVDQEDDFNIRRPEELIKAQLEASETFALLLIAIASVSLVVGGIGVMNVMLASVAERTAEIGLRLAVGARRSAIQAQFLVESIVLTMFGGVLGIVVSVAGSYVIAAALEWPISIPARALGLAIVFSVVVGVFFGSYPAWIASRLDPITALRRE
jgi:putative ABC transport system permease protein